MKQPSGKIWLIATMMGIAIIVIVGAYLGKEQEEKEDAQAITLMENRTVAFGEEVYVSDFIQEIKGTITENNKIDTTTVGEKEVTVYYRNLRNKKKQATYTIQIVDKVAPVIMLGNSYTVKVGYQKDLFNVIFSGDNADDTPTRKIEGNYNVNEVGEYPLTYIIKDASGNEARKEFVLKVVEEETKTEKEKKEWSDILATYKTDNRQIGIDVSKWQKEIDWQKVKDAGVEFAILRIGYQTNIGGEKILDPYFYQNIQGAKEVGLPVGVYFYSYASSEQEAKEEADWIVDQLKGDLLELPISFDWENWTSFPEFHISFSSLNKIANAFLERVKERGYMPSLYGSKIYLEKIWANTSCPVWLAHYTDKTNYSGSYYMWQICETGRVDGIEEDVDIDILFSSEMEK